MDHYLDRRRQDFDAVRQAARDADAMLYQKLAEPSAAHALKAIRSQADADLDQIIIPAVRRRERAIGFRTATAVVLSGVPDSEVPAVSQAMTLSLCA